MKVNQFYVATCTSSDPSVPLPPDKLVASSSDPAILAVENKGDDTVIVSGVGPGTATVTYSAPGFKPATETVVVEDLPQILVSDGSIQTK